jgi:NAD(P)-dependent dehydrogenase (short-subunit alcohol dehydrogenase family)
MLHEGTLDGRTALVTGGGTGIGMAVATELGRLSADVVVASRELDHVEQGAASVPATGARAFGVSLDIRDAAARRPSIG